MQSALSSYYTLPADIMLSESVPNLVVPVAVGASHVAFASVRVEPTWLLLGGAAGIMITIATEMGCLPRSVPILRLQLRVATQQPIVYFSDLPFTSPYFVAMQVLGPWGVADTLQPSLTAAPTSLLSKSEAANWIVGALRARNSTIGFIQPPPAPRNHGSWADFGPEDRFFEAAAFCAQAGAFPEPTNTQEFHPLDPVTATDFARWADKILGSVAWEVLGQSMPPGPCRRGDAAVYLFELLHIRG